MKITKHVLDTAVGNLRGALGEASFSDALARLGHRLEDLTEPEILAWAGVVGSDLYAVVSEQGANRETAMATVVLEGFLIGLALEHEGS